MARAPLQVLVLPFRRRADGGIEYAVFRRADQVDAWQGLAGGAEKGETAEQAARREMTEESRIPGDAFLIPLDATASVPAVHFAESKTWGRDVYVVTERTFGVRVPDGHTITLSDEHAEYRWLSYEAAASLLTWDSNKIASDFVAADSKSNDATIASELRIRCSPLGQAGSVTWDELQRGSYRFARTASTISG